MLEPRRLLAAGDLDTTFGDAGVAAAAIGTGKSSVFDMAVEPDGKLVAVGVAQNQGYAAARYNADGSLDSSFGNSGTLILSSAGSAWRVAIQPDGKILLAGDTNNGTGNALVLRLTTAGALDTTFGADGEATVHVGGTPAVALDSSGNILVAGDTGGGFDVARLSSDGALDTAFGNDGFASFAAPDANGSLANVTMQQDGKIVVGGTAGAVGATGFAAVRFNSNGIPDTTFGNGGIAQSNIPGTDFADAAVIQSDGKIIVAGESYGPPNQVSYNLAMTRFNSDGSLDTTFGNRGQVVDQVGSQLSAIFNMLIEPNGKIVAAGQADGYAALFRFNSDGSLDQTFGSGGVALALQNTTGVDVGEGRAVVEQADGKYVMASDQFTLERFIGAPPPMTTGIADVSLPENSSGTIVALANAFQGGSVPASQLAYSITSDSNPALFASTGINSQTRDLTLNFAANKPGAAQLTVRAVDPDGAYTEASFQITLTSDPIDASYAINGVAQAVFGADDATAQASALQPDGKLIVAGGLEAPQTHQPLGFAVARFNTDGSLDTSFGSDGMVVVAAGGAVHHLAIQSDGRILISGDDGGNLQQKLLVRLTYSGVIDTTFGNNGQVLLNGISSDFTLLPDGQIMSVQGDTGNYQVTRLQSNGSLDTTFGQNGTVVSQANTVLPPNDVAVDGQGNISICGEQNGGVGQTYVAVTRFGPAGGIDNTFGNDGVARMTLRGVVDDLNCLAIQSDGKILAGGLSVNPVTKIGWDLVLMRYDTDGSLDSTFGNGGIVIHTMPKPLDTAINQMFVEPNGKIVAAGRLGEDAALFRFNTDGSLDTTFAGGGIAAASSFQHDGYGAVEDANGDYLLAGSQGTPVHFAVERFLGETPLTTSGISDVNVAENSPSTVIALPNHFQGGSVPGRQLTYSITSDSNPALFVATSIDPQTSSLTLAYVANASGSAQLTVRATDPDGASVESSFNVMVLTDEPFSPGSLDLTFGTNGAVVTPTQGIFATLDSAHVQPDGKILAAGMIQPSASTNGDYTVTRYNPDGTVDFSFGDNGLATAAIDGDAFGTALQTDGKILVSGNNSFGDAVIVRFNADGTLDSFFGADGVVSAAIGSGKQIALQQDQKMVIVTTNEGDFGVARFNSDGTPDTTFGSDGMVRTAVGVGNRSVVSGVAIQPDGKIVVTGWAWNGSKLDFGVVRYDANGALDTSFGNAGIVMTSLSKGNDEANDLTIQSDGKILVSGDSSGEGALVRYNADGALDTSFGQAGTVLVPEADVLYQPIAQFNGYIVAAGDVGSFGFGVFRFHSDGTLDASFNKTGFARASGLAGVAEAIAVAPDGDYVVTGTGDLAPTYTTGSFALARFDGSFAPTTSGVSDVKVMENAPATVIPLVDDFEGGSVPAAQLVYSITADSNPGLFASATIDRQTGELTLVYAPSTAGPAELTVTATDPEGGAVEASFGVTVTALPDAPLTAAGATIAAVEGAGFRGTVAAFTDADLSATTADFTATIDWGDSSAPSTVSGSQISESAGAFSIAGGHVYAEEGSYTMKITVSDSGGATATVNSLATVGDASVSVTATAVRTTEGSIFNGTVATFNDANPGSTTADFAATIDWGDASAPTTVSGSQISETVGTFGVAGSHLYAEEGSYTMTITLSDSGGETTTINPVATVGDASLSATGVVLTATEGATLIATVATFSDADAGGTSADYSAVIDWGDNSALTTVSGSQITEAGDSFVVPGSHAYAEEGIYTLTVAISDVGGATTTINAVATVGDASLSATAVVVTATEGATLIATIAAFSDADPGGTSADYSAVIDWGDNSALTTVSGSQITEAGHSFVVPGTHVYADEGTHTLTVAISDVGGETATVNPVVTVRDASLSITAVVIGATEGSTFSGAAATFTDSDPSATTADFTATIDWGDSSARSTVSGSQISESAGAFSITGGHVYAEEGSYTMTITVNDGGGETTAVKSVANVADAKLQLTAAAGVNPAGGEVSNLLLATFTDGGGTEPIGNYSAAIDWGDGATSAGTIASSNGVFQITGNHQYARAGSFTIAVSVKDDGGSMDALVEAADVPLTPHQEYVIAVYHDVLDRAPDLAGLAYWAAQLDHGTAVSSVAQAIAHSDEYYANFVIKPDYLKLLGRAADKPSVAYWTQKMQNGLTDQQLEAALAASDEFYARGGESDDGRGDQNVDWLDAVYKLLLGRAAGAGDETYWVDKLTSGVSRGQVMQWIANSAENDSQLIEADYQKYLGRTAEPDGLDYWLSQFADGETNEDVIAGFTGSAEYYQKHTS